MKFGVILSLETFKVKLKSNFMVKFLLMDDILIQNNVSTWFKCPATYLNDLLKNTFPVQLNTQTHSCSCSCSDWCSCFEFCSVVTTMDLDMKHIQMQFTFFFLIRRGNKRTNGTMTIPNFYRNCISSGEISLGPNSLQHPTCFTLSLLVVFYLDFI